MTLSGLEIKECVKMDSFQYEEKYTEASQNGVHNSTMDNWQIGASVTIIRRDGTVSYGVIAGPGLVNET